MRRLAAPALIVLLLPGCMEKPKPEPAKRPLYERLGGEPAIAQVVDDFFALVLADPKLRAEHKEHFAKGDVAGLKRKLIDQVGEATGGPQKYAGKSMRDAHKGLGITNADFDALLADLDRALEKNYVAEADRKELLDLLRPMRGEVVERPEARPAP